MNGGSAEIDRKLEILRWCDPENSIDLLEDLAAYFHFHPELETGSFFGDVHSRLQRQTAWSPSTESAWLTDESEGRRDRVTSASELLRRVLSKSDQELRSGASITADQAAALRHVVLELYENLQPFGNCRLAIGTFGSANSSGTFAFQYLSLQGDGLRLPLLPGAPRVARDEAREGGLWWIGSREPLPLFPFVIFEPAQTGQEQVGFVQFATTRTAQREGKSVGTRKLVYLDYQSGDYLSRYDAARELAELLTRLKKRTVTPGEVRAISEAAAAELSGPVFAELDEDESKWIGDFHILGELGHGAMGIVYKARQASLGRTVALKVLPPKIAVDPLAIRRFALEVEMLGRCDHANIVKVLTAGQAGESRYYAMEFVDGSDLGGIYSVLSRWRPSLAGHLTEGHLVAAISSHGAANSRQQSNTESLTPDEDNAPIQPNREAIRRLASGKNYYRRLAEIIGDAARGLQHLHDHGILHRDLKPSNLMLTADGRRAIVMDLGLAKASDQASLAGSSQVKILGTLRYMAPEQLSRKLIHLTGQADVYGLGATLYELACLGPIFDGDTEERLTAQVLFEQPEKPRKRAPEIPKPLELIIERATAKQPANRYRTAAELAEDLESFAQHGFTIHAKPPNFFQRGRKQLAVHGRKITAIAAGIFLLVAAVWTWDYNRVKTQSFMSTVDRWQVPQGVAFVGSTESKHMNRHTELRYRRGKLIEMRNVDSAGMLRDNDEGESEWRYYYRQSGSLEKIEGLDHNEIVQRVARISEGASTRTYETKGGAAAVSHSKEDQGGSKATEIERVKFDYDQKGYSIRSYYQNRFGLPRPSVDGNYGLGFERLPQGLVRRFWELDATGQKQVSASGIFDVVYDRDKQGMIVRTCFFDRSGQSAAGPNGFSCVNEQRDSVGNWTKISYLGPDGKPVISKANACAALTARYDSRGYRTEWQCLGQMVDSWPIRTGSLFRT